MYLQTKLQISNENCNYVKYQLHNHISINTKLLVNYQLQIQLLSNKKLQVNQSQHLS